MSAYLNVTNAEIILISHWISSCSNLCFLTGYFIFKPRPKYIILINDFSNLFLMHIYSRFTRNYSKPVQAKGNQFLCDCVSVQSVRLINQINFSDLWSHSVFLYEMKKFKKTLLRKNKAFFIDAQFLYNKELYCRLEIIIGINNSFVFGY